MTTRLARKLGLSPYPSGGPLTKQRLKYWKKRVELDQSTRMSMLEVFERGLKDERDTISKFESEWVDDELAQLEQYEIDLAELLLVEIYHWVERGLKSLLKVKIKDDANRMVWDELKKGFEEHYAVRIPLAKEYQHMTVLGFFAGSWKHEPIARPASKLRKTLLIEKGEVGLLSNERVAAAMRKKMHTGDNATMLDLVRCSSESGAKFLAEVADLLPAS